MQAVECLDDEDSAGFFIDRLVSGFNQSIKFFIGESSVIVKGQAPWSDRKCGPAGPVPRQRQVSRHPTRT